MKKKIFKTLLAVAIAVSLIVAVNLMANAEAEGNYYYTIENGGATITNRINHTGGDIVVPSTLGGYPVKRIGEFVFYGDKDVTSIELPKGITSIDNRAFWNCTSLESITFPDSIENIGHSLFRNCISLKSVTLPKNIKIIKYDTFYDCSALTEFTIPEGVVEIGENAFYNCSSLTTISIPSTLTKIEAGCFTWCSSLKNININDINAWCSISFEDAEACPLSYGDNLYLNNIIVTNIKLSNSITSIADYAFRGCYSLTSITIPDSVTTIGDYAFGYCKSLTSIDLPDLVTSIGDYTFSGTSITDIVIPNGVTKIGMRAFENCRNLKSVVIPNGITNMGEGVFYRCSGLESATISNDITKIERDTFYECSSLDSVVIPNSVTSIANYAFFYCSSLENVYYGGTEEQWNNIAIGNNNGYLTSATIHYLGEPADYSAIESALEIVDALDRTLYTEASLKELDAVVAGIDYTLTLKDQDKVYAYATTIVNAVSELQLKADYSTIESALEMVDDLDRTLYTEKSLKELDDVVAGIDYSLSVKDQDKVDAYATTIVNAVSELQLKADYSTIESALAMVDALDRTLYTEKSLKELDDVVAGIDYTLSIDEQDVVDACATSIVDAIARLVFKPADYSVVEEALAKVPADLSKYTVESAQLVTDSVNAVVYDLTADWQSTVDAYAQAIEDAVANLEIFGTIKLTDDIVDYRLRCTTAVVNGNLVLTAEPAGTSSMKVRLGNLPEGATVAIVGTNANASMANGIITVTNPGMKNVNVPMVITSAEGLETEFVLVADFNNAIRYATYARLSQIGNNITVTSGAATAYVLFDTTDIVGGYVEVENVSRNLLGRYVVSESAVRFYNPVYDEGTVTVNVKNADGETVETYNVTVTFADATEYTAVLDTSLRCTYEVDGDNITVTADAGVSNVYLNFGRYYSESLSASVNNDIVKKMGARSWRIMAADEPIEFDLYFDATAYGAEKVTRHVTVNF